MRFLTRIKLGLVVIVASVAAFLGSASAAGGGAVMYSSIPAVLSGNVISQAFEATQTVEFGDHVGFVGGAGKVRSATVVMSSWGCQSGGWTTNNCVTTPGATFSHPITLNLYYNVGTAGNPIRGGLIATKTQTFNIPFRPSASPSCTGGRWFSTEDNACYNGLATKIDFDFGSPGVNVPADVIWGVAYNTSDYGATPLRPQPCNATPAGCGYDSLNVGAETLALTGSDIEPDGAFLNSTWAGAYCSGTPGSFNFDHGTVVPQCTGWTDYRPMAEFRGPTGDDCKNGGWQQFTAAPGPFKNQGDCVSYFATNGKNTASPPGQPHTNNGNSKHQEP